MAAYEVEAAAAGGRRARAVTASALSAVGEGGWRCFTTSKRQCRAFCSSETSAYRTSGRQAAAHCVPLLLFPLDLSRVAFAACAACTTTGASARRTIAGRCARFHSPPRTHTAWHVCLRPRPDGATPGGRDGSRPTELGLQPRERCMPCSVVRSPPDSHSAPSSMPRRCHMIGRGTVTRFSTFSTRAARMPPQLRSVLSAVLENGWSQSYPLLACVIMSHSSFLEQMRVRDIHMRTVGVSGVSPFRRSPRLPRARAHDVHTANGDRYPGRVWEDARRRATTRHTQLGRTATGHARPPHSYTDPKPVQSPKKARPGARHSFYKKSDTSVTL